MEGFCQENRSGTTPCSVVEYLFPRMDIGLLHADITQQMCDAWMSTIVLTICQRGKMSGVHNTNRKAFCLLANIPDLWLRTQTSRASELLVNLNSSRGSPQSPGF